MASPLRIALLGCGVVGRGVVSLLADNHAYLARRIGAPIEIAHVVVRDLDKARAALPPNVASVLTQDATMAIDDPSVEVVVELAGGLEPAGTWLSRALGSGRSVVTANKALLAERGGELLAIARKNKVDLAFEASVGGAIPIVRTLRDHLVSDWVRSLHGIVNGTCNYILTRMRDEGAPFAEVLADAQRLGYAEAEPSLDVDGHDAAHKLCVLAMLAFGAEVSPKDVWTEGIRGVQPIDHRYAARFGFAIKHLAVGREVAGALDLRVAPAMVPARMPLASVDGVLNAIALEADGAGAQVLVGRGAGSLPTAVSVVADLVDVARARRAGASGLSTLGLELTARPVADPGEQRAAWYLRMRVTDRPGVLAQIAGCLGAHEVSIAELVQEGASGRRSTDRARAAAEDAEVRAIVMLTHEARTADVRAALVEIEKLAVVAEPAFAMRIA
jgi:homoserine dehydrogenase